MSWSDATGGNEEQLTLVSLIAAAKFVLLETDRFVKPMRGRMLFVNSPSELPN